MSVVTLINKFFSLATKEEVKDVKEKILLTPRQEIIFNSYYLKKQNADFIADSLNVSTPVIHKELRRIREKIIRVLDTK